MITVYWRGLGVVIVLPVAIYELSFPDPPPLKGVTCTSCQFSIQTSYPSVTYIALPHFPHPSLTGLILFFLFLLVAPQSLWTSATKTPLYISRALCPPPS